MARRQRRDLLVFESSCHLPICLPHTMEASHCPFNCWTSSREAVNTNFYSLWFDSTGNRTRVYRFSSRRSIHSTTDRFIFFVFYLFLSLFFIFYLFLSFLSVLFIWSVCLFCFFLHARSMKKASFALLTVMANILLIHSSFWDLMVRRKMTLCMFRHFFSM